MKLIARISPKNLKLSPKRFFSRSKKDQSTLSRSDPSSFSSGISSSSSSDASVSNGKSGSGGGGADIGTPTSVLPGISGDYATVFSSDIYYELAHAIKLIDRDNDGVVSRTELEKLLTRLGAEPPSQEEVSLMMSELDRDGDGVISQEALLSRVFTVGSGGGSVCNEPARDVELRETFEFFDLDQDGKISAEELFNFFSTLGDEQCTLEDCRRMIAGVDKNGDGFVCFDDFARMMELQR